MRRRCLSSLSPLTGFVFDIDGVLLRGRELIPDADVAIQRLWDRRRESVQWPVCFLTNGGGMTEKEKASQLSDLLHVQIHDRQVVMAHTPMQSLVERFRSAPVLLSGKGDLLKVAKSYGFERPVTTEQLFHAFPSAAPLSSFIPPQIGPCPVRTLGYGTAQDPFQAVLVMTDPVDWVREIQLITDVVVSDGVPGAQPTCSKGGNDVVEIHIGSRDLLWANDFPLPRFGLGAFSLAFQTLFQAYTEKQPKITYYGKPTEHPFKMTEMLLKEQLISLGHGDRELERIYMIGDNPQADIKGARNAGHPWVSVLVRTGVFSSDAANDRLEPADIVEKHVLDFIQQTIERTNKS